MNKKQEILQMYFNEHKKQNEIAVKLKISQSYVSQVIKKDWRYNEEKRKRHCESLIKKAEYNKQYCKGYKRKSKKDNSYEQLQAQLEKDSRELSYRNGISNYDFTKWNSSIYHRDSKGNLRLNKNVKTGFDVPKFINMNIKVPTQKYKQKCVNC